MTLYLLAMGGAFIFIFLRAFQQRNVAYANYGWMTITSYLMTAVEVKLIQMMSHNEWGWIVFWIGTGAWMGSISATYLHKRYLSK